ncbi:hypothetical protein GCM10022631_33000 [Deinococcus rubellus]|uniref:EAL domain-containing protein n=1 Tax=Deinococcus rubellus TaxID=1889240 RepID=A0ABY5YDT1_9DEIO|nr:EAL domain-containing protein [Deinococcus rubellus]UWX63227.1 EAL domain-containing protein [Deinococcus rubellus]
MKPSPDLQPSPSTPPPPAPPADSGGPQERALVFLGRIRETLARTSALPELFHDITAAIQQVFGYPLVSLLLIENGQIKPQVSFGYAGEGRYSTGGMTYPLDFGILGRVARSGEAALVSDVGQDPDYQVYRQGVVSQLCLPLHDDGRVGGLLNIETTAVMLDEEDLRLMQILCQHLDSALGRVRLDAEAAATHARDQQLYAEIARQARELALLHQVRNTLSRDVAIDDIIRSVNAAIVQAFGYTQVSVYLLDRPYGGPPFTEQISRAEADTEACLVLQHQIGYREVLDRVPTSQGVMGRVVRSGQAELIADVQLESAFVGAIENITSEVTVPLRVQGQVVGTLNVESVDGMGLLARDLELMTEVAAQLGQALERAQLLETARLSEARYRLLAESMTDLVCLHAPDGQVTYVSPSVTALLGYAPAAMLGTFPRDLVHPDDRVKLESTLRRWQRPDQQERFRLRLRHLGGQWLWFETSSAPVPSGQGHWQSTSRDIGERWLIEQRLAFEAQHDPLTGLANRSLFERRLQDCLDRAQRRGPSAYAVLFLDVDRFKIINDSLGHRVGDQLLIELARRLTANVPTGALLARMGGDEFAVLLRGSAAEAEQLARRLIKALNTPLEVGTYQLQLSISIGIALGHPDYAETGDVLRDADLGMYESKHRQKTRASSAYRVFDRSLHERALRRLHIESELRLALEKRQLQLFYQPVVRLSDRKLLGFEALARWFHPELGEIKPGEFLSVAEETGLIWPLGQWVLETACTQLSEWQRLQPGSAVSLNVNLSPPQFQQTDLVRQVRRAIHKSGAQASGLNLEITEGAMLQSSAAQTISALRELGVGVQVDDFGTGYSSLASLHRFDLTALKIDRHFVDNLGRAQSNHSVVQAILALAEALKLTVIAEGVETERQRLSLLALGCSVGQGFLFAPALRPAEATQRWQQGI